MKNAQRILLIALGTTLLLTGCNGIGGSNEASTASSSSAKTLTTYRNEKFGFELQYPAAWKVSEESRNRQYLGSDIIFTTGSGAIEGINMDPAKNRTIRWPIQFLEKKLVRGIEDTTVGGEPGKIVRLSGLNNNSLGITYIYVKHGDTIYQFKTKGPMLDEGVIASMRFFATSSSPSRQ